MIRLLHILSAAVMFGVGVGAAWFMLMAVRSRDPAAIVVTTRNAVAAEWALAVPAAIIQPLTGYLLMRQLGIPLHSTWFLWVAALYMGAGMCWVYLVRTEYRLRALATGHAASGMPAEFAVLLRQWLRLAAGAFGGVLAIYVLMVFRPAF